MIFLKQLARKITTNDKIIKNIESLKSDKEILEYLKSNNIFLKDFKNIFEKHYGITHINLNDYKIDDSLIDLFDSKKMANDLVLPYKEDKENKIYYFAMNNVFNNKLKNNLKNSCKQIGYNAEFDFLFEYEIREFYEKYEKEKQIKNVSEKEFNAEDILNSLINNAIDLNASDIHIEQLEHQLQTRYRIDGILTNKKIFDYTKGEISNIIGRIKVLSGMDIAEKRKAQDGRLDNFKYKNSDEILYDIRVSSVNTINGEKLVLRLFDKTNKIKNFKELGFSDLDIEKTKRILKNPNGIIYLAGATGSGKTTTLYTMLEYLNSDEINIYTIEDPIEKTIIGINQIQIDVLGGITYPSTLRALLRQDPNIIVVGEIRDVETADLSMRASLTGHLVLTTIHANNAIDSISRLYDMGAEPYLLSASSLAFMSQRLVRVLCPYCKKRANKLDDYEMDWIKKTNKNAEIKEMNIYRADGCNKCTNGYKGRRALVEIIEVTDKIRNLISNKASYEDIYNMATKEGFNTLAYQGLSLVSKGITSINEIIKTI